MGRKNKPKITANFLTANSDFKKIKDANFEKYFSESVLQTLENYLNRSSVKKMWSKGFDSDIFIPQLHGKEHFNVRF